MLIYNQLTSFGAGGASIFLFTKTVTALTANFNLAAQATAAGWNGVDAIDAIVTVDAGIKIYSASAGTPGFVADSLPAGSRMTLNMGAGAVIYGAAGYGGVGASPSAGPATVGQAGGTALKTSIPITLTNLGTIAGGGGGGGGGAYVIVTTGDPKGGYTYSYYGGGGGGGGRGYNGGAGGAGGYGATLSGQNGAAGTETAPGTGGRDGNNGARGGNGGALGTAGSTASLTAGGIAGKAIDGVSYVTFATTGTITGTQSG